MSITLSQTLALSPKYKIASTIRQVAYKANNKEMERCVGTPSTMFYGPFLKWKTSQHFIFINIHHFYLSFLAQANSKELNSGLGVFKVSSLKLSSFIFSAIFIYKIINEAVYWANFLSITIIYLSIASAFLSKIYWTTVIPIVALKITPIKVKKNWGLVSKMATVVFFFFFPFLFWEKENGS